MSSLGRAAGVDFLALAYAQRGILKYLGDDSGESFLIRHHLAATMPCEPCFIDVGANIGDYTAQLHLSFPTAKIFSFEPNPDIAKSLANRVAQYATVVPAAIGDRVGTAQLFNSSDASASEHGSLHANALTDLHGYTSLSNINVPITTLDDFSARNAIGKIDFLKIDTEGSELAVLSGSQRLLREGRIEAIQFEFNEMNIISRVFLKDFFALLPNFDFYRLDTAQLHRLRYSPREELFQFQNILAVSSEGRLAANLKERYAA